MRYARFRTSVDNQVQKKEAAAAKNEGKDEETKDIKPSLSRSTSKSKPKEPKEPKEHKDKEYKPRQPKTVVKRLREDSSDFSFSDIKDVKKQDMDEKEKENKSFLDPEMFSDHNFTETLEFKPKLKQESGVLETKTNEKAMEDLLANASFNSSLPSPPTEAVQSMESIERKKKIRKMYAFSPTMKAGTLHQIPLPRGAVPPSSRIHSLPALSTATGSPNTPVNLSGVLMMRHHSAGSMTEQVQQQQQQILRQTRMMTPSSDTDLHQNNHHNHQQYFAHHTQIPLMTDPAVVGGFDPTFDFNTGAASVGGSTTGHPSPWMATPFSSPPMPTFDMSPYTATLDMMGGAATGNADADAQPLPGLFQTEFDSQQQQNEALQASIMAQAFTKNSGWDVMLGQASNGNQNHSI